MSNMYRTYIFPIKIPMHVCFPMFIGPASFPLLVFTRRVSPGNQVLDSFSGWVSHHSNIQFSNINMLFFTWSQHWYFPYSHCSTTASGYCFGPGLPWRHGSRRLVWLLCLTVWCCCCVYCYWSPVGWSGRPPPDKSLQSLICHVMLHGDMETHSHMVTAFHLNSAFLYNIFQRSNEVKHEHIVNRLNYDNWKVFLLKFWVQWLYEGSILPSRYRNNIPIVHLLTTN